MPCSQHTGWFTRILSGFKTIADGGSVFINNTRHKTDLIGAIGIVIFFVCLKLKVGVGAVAEGSKTEGSGIINN